jgi:hypothetical protein
VFTLDLNTSEHLNTSRTWSGISRIERITFFVHLAATV